ncbi:MAG TPA: efflux RND transporter periplasmic adaptor subunit [Limnobacter sp.]|uniref:efflux RND transporter periplasmic adaptor subunit n=1 Tax=Limnobacter sp. TaxID=2003368 RepID=UPI002ED9039A
MRVPLTFHRLSLGVSSLVLSSVCVAATAEPVLMTPAQIKAARIQTAPVTSTQQQSGALTLSGTVRPSSSGLLAVPATEDVSVAEVVQPNLSMVKKGDVVLKVFGAALVQAQQALLNAATSARLEHQNLRRDSALLQDGLIAQRRLQDTQARVQMAQFGVQAARQTLLGMGLSADTVRRIEHSGEVRSPVEIQAPANGQLNSLTALAGQRVKAGDPLFQVATAQQPDVLLNASTSQAALVAVGDGVVVPGCTAPGRVTGVGQSINPDTQALDIRVAMPASPCLRLNQLVQATIQSQRKPADPTGFAVPAQAVLNNAGQRWIFIQNTQGFDAVEVQVLSQTGDTAAIRPIHARPNLAQAQVAVSGLALIKGAWRGLGAE